MYTYYQSNWFILRSVCTCGTGCNELVGCIHQLTYKIWIEKKVCDWNGSVVCPFLKKGEPTTSTNYRGIILLSIAYKVLKGVLCEQLMPLIKTLT